jgi:ABC-2 type transport system permease protein
MLYFNLLQKIPDQRTAELIDATDFEIVVENGKSTEADNQWINIILPFFSGILFMVVVNVSGGYLLQAVVEEKENRTMEIMVTSVSPTELMGGKIIGNLSVGLTQLLFWLIFPLIGVLIARNFIPILNDLTFGNQFFWLTIIILIPAFIMVAAFMAMVGATATEAKEAQQVAGLFTLPIVAPYWFISIIMNKPNGALAVGLSLFPLSAPVTLPLRTVFTTVPTWQIALSLVLLVLCAAGAVWLAGRAFRIGMLRYGKRLSLKEIFRRA